jgi:hypothetical protein
MYNQNGDSARTEWLTRIVVPLLFAVVILPPVAHAECPTPPNELIEIEVSEDGARPSIAMDSCGRFAVTWQEHPFSRLNTQDVLVRYFDELGDPQSLPLFLSEDIGSFGLTHYDPSIATSGDGLIRVGWIVDCEDCDHFYRGEATELSVVFEYGETPPQKTMPPPEDPPATQWHLDPSAGIFNGTAGLTSWVSMDVGDPGPGVVWGEDYLDQNIIHGCNSFCHAEWKPCIAMRQSDGAFAVAWAYAETNFQESVFNIALRVYSSTGTLLATREGGSDGWANDPTIEVGDSSQLSPAVTFDDQNNIVVTWVGLELPEYDSAFRIFARRFKFDAGEGEIRDPDPNAGEGRAGIFVVDDRDPGLVLFTEYANPTVALKQFEGQIDLGADYGSFVVAWNVSTNVGQEIHVKYFNEVGHARGSELRFNEADGEDDLGTVSKP